MFSLFNFSSIFPEGSADPICTYVRTPMFTASAPPRARRTPVTPLASVAICSARNHSTSLTSLSPSCTCAHWPTARQGAPRRISGCMRQSTESRPNKSVTITVVHWSNFFNQTQPNPLQSENFGRTNQPNPQPNRTPHNQQQTFGHKEYNLGALFHRNMMTVSKTPVNTYDNCQ